MNYARHLGNENLNQNYLSEALSTKEKEVVYWLSEGLSSKMIGDKMQITKNTVEAHRKRIFKRIGASNVAAAIAYAFRNNILD